MHAMSKLAGAVAGLCMAVCAVGTANATVYTYVGSWAVDSGPWWTTNPPVYSGQQAAALLFGGSASQYAISTVDSNPADINFKAWLDGWGDPFTYALNGTPAAQSYSLDTGGGGYNSNPGYQSAYSAYVSDHGVNLVNYAFVASGVPEPSTWIMMLLGFAGVGFAGYRRTKKSMSAFTAA